MCQFATKWSDDGTVAEPTFLQEPTFQQSYPWNINDDWSNWCSQILDDVQTISVVSVPQTIPVVSVPQAKSVILKKTDTESAQSHEELEIIIKNLLQTC